MVQALNGGGPGTANMLIVQYIYQTGFERAEIGYASAASMVLMVILIVIAVIQMRFDEGGTSSHETLLVARARRARWCCGFSRSVFSSRWSGSCSARSSRARAVQPPADALPGELDRRAATRPRGTRFDFGAVLPQHRRSSAIAHDPAHRAGQRGDRVRAGEVQGLVAEGCSSSASWPPRCCRPR